MVRVRGGHFEARAKLANARAEFSHSPRWRTFVKPRSRLTTSDACSPRVGYAGVLQAAVRPVVHRTTEVPIGRSRGERIFNDPPGADGHKIVAIARKVVHLAPAVTISYERAGKEVLYSLHRSSRATASV